MNGHAHHEKLERANEQKLGLQGCKPVQQKLPKRTKKKAEDEGLLSSFCTLVCDNQIGAYCRRRQTRQSANMCPGISVNLLLLLFLTHIFFPRARRRTSKFLHLSYYNPDSGMYGCGTDDLPLVALWIVILTGARVAVMDYILDPLARLGGVRSKQGLVRFKEQGWLIVYYTCSWSLGMVRS